MARIEGAGHELHAVQQGVDDSITRAVPDWIRNGRLIEDVEVTAPSEAIVHGLGRVPQGWMALNPRGTTNPTFMISTDKDASTITLQIDNTTTIDLWVW